VKSPIISMAVLRMATSISLSLTPEPKSSSFVQRYACKAVRISFESATAGHAFHKVTVSMIEPMAKSAKPRV